MAKMLRVLIYKDASSPIVETTVARVIWHNSGEKLWDVIAETMAAAKMFCCDEPCLYIFPANVAAVEIRPVEREK